MKSVRALAFLMFWLLAIMPVATAVEVKAEAARIVTDSSDHATDVNLKQLEETPIRGRNWEGFVKDLPGVIDIGAYDQRGWKLKTHLVSHCVPKQ